MSLVKLAMSRVYWSAELKTDQTADLITLNWFQDESFAFLIMDNPAPTG
jgi:hypothetical protein